MRQPVRIAMLRGVGTFAANRARAAQISLPLRRQTPE
jgi:hypothetical protein